MDEDLEFRDMVLKKLTESGSLLEIKAKLRALLYDIISQEQPGIDSTNESDISSSTFEKDIEAQLDGKTLAFEIILEMLGSLNLQYTKQIFMVESGHQRTARPKEQLIRQLGLTMSETEDAAHQQPILLRLIEKSRNDAAENSDIDTVTDLSPDSKACSSGKMDENSEVQNTLPNE
uniref:FGFR1 oncogene partner (FOP) N-terminal dimerisation domain-containing protein n=1 Tax=Anopheles atroparvus TaxID=41427 RepID=A0AAG5CRT2_ANOAO